MKLVDKIDWGLLAGVLPAKDGCILFGKITDTSYVLVPQSQQATCYAPMLLVNPHSPSLRGGPAKKFAANILKVKHQLVQQAILELLVEYSQGSQADMDRVTIIQTMLPFEACLDYSQGDSPNILHDVYSPIGWAVDLMGYQKLLVKWYEIKDVLQEALPKALCIEGDVDFDEESWVLAMSHNLSYALVSNLETLGIGIRPKPRRKR